VANVWARSSCMN